MIYFELMTESLRSLDNVKTSLCIPLTLTGRSGGVNPLILNLSIRGTWVCSFTSQTISVFRKNTDYHWTRAWIGSRVVVAWRKYFLPLPLIEPKCFGRRTRNLSALPAEKSRRPTQCKVNEFSKFAVGNVTKLSFPCWDIRCSSLKYFNNFCKYTVFVLHESL